MTTNEITAAARRKVLETTTEIVSDSTVLLYANQAYIEVYKRAYSANQVESSTVTCTDGVCTLPADYGRMYSKALDTDENEYEEVSIANFHQEELDYVYTIENGQLLVDNEDITSLTVRYYPQPAELTDSVDPTIDPYYHEPIVYGTVWRIYEDLQDEELSQFYKEKFESDLNQRVALQSSYEENNQRGGEMFSYQRLI
jgi:hypothetical protein